MKNFPFCPVFPMGASKVDLTHKFDDLKKSDTVIFKKTVKTVLTVSIHKHVKQNNLAKWKSRIEMGKMAVNGPRILFLLTASPLRFFFWRGRLIYLLV